MRRRLATTVLVARRAALVGALAGLLLGLGNRQGSTERAPRVDVVFVVDRTTSMSALDHPAGSRVTAVRDDLVQLSRYLDAARFGLVTFGKDVAVPLPLTSDRSQLEGLVRDLQVEKPREGTGSSLGRPVDEVLRQVGLVQEREGRLAVVVLATDGESTSPEPRASFAAVGDEVDTALVLGYGTTEGGVMPIRQVPPDQLPPAQEDAGPLIPDRDSGKPARSRLDEPTLRDVAEELGGSYVLSDGEADMRQVAAEVTRAAYAGLDPVDPDRELRWAWALLLLALGLLELAAGVRSSVRAHRELRS